MANTGAFLGRALSASYDNSPVLIPPIDNDVKDALYFFQGAEADAIRNRAPGGVGTMLTRNGGVVFNGTHVSCVAGSAFFDSVHDEVDTYTAFIVANTTADLIGSAHQPMPFGNFNGSSGSSIYLQNHSSLPAPAARLRNNMYTTIGNNQATVNIADATQWFFGASRLSATSEEIDDKTHGFNGVAVAPSGTRVLAARKMRFGSAYSGSLTGTCNMAAAGYFPGRYFTNAQLTAIYNFVKAYLAQPSISIVI